MSESRRPNCPDDEVLQELAAGILAPALAEQTVQHVARCSTCGPALRRYVREFSGETSSADAAILAQLQSSKPNWQKRLVRKLIGGGTRFPWLKLAPAAAALAAVVFAVVQGPALWADFQLHQAQKQVAAAFGDRRTTEMRLPSVQNAPYRPFPIELGAENGRGLDEVPTSLHDATGAANKNLRAAKADPRWLQVQGLALLWESTPNSLEKAEKDFEKARAEGLASPSLEIDLAASYFERDSRSEHPNLQRTLNLLSEVLSRPNLDRDDQASALFNLAIAYEKTQAWDLAVETWQKYLQADPSSSWSNEARQHLKDAQAKTSGRRQQSYSDPSFFLQQKAQGTLRPEDPEQYQQKALSQWLPVAVADKNSDAYRALQGLAEVFAEHQDFWWRDFLNETTPKSADAVRALTSAVLANEQGFHNQAVDKARAAIALFEHNKNVSGVVLASLQEVYASRSLLLGGTCLARADPLRDKLAATKYEWLQAQLALEKAQCRNFHGDLAESDNDAQASLRIAERFKFPVLEMRILGISASMHNQQGRCEGAWEQSVQGLSRYWRGAYPGDRLDQFYAVLWQCTQKSGALYLAEALLNHTLELRQGQQTTIGKNPIREGLLHLRLGNMFLAQRRFDLADSENKRATDLLESIPEAYAKEYRMIIEIEPAELQLQQGDPVRALATLKPVRDHLKSIQDNFINATYYRLRGDIQWELKKLDEAVAAYQAAIDLAEAPLENLKDRGDRLAWLRAVDDSYRGLVRVLIAQNDPVEALSRWESYKSKIMLSGLDREEISAPVANGARKPNWRTRLPLETSEGGRLVYAQFRDGLEIWLSSKQGMRSAWVAVRQQDFDRVVRSFAEHCATPDSSLSELHEQGSWLFSKLLQPVISELPSMSITVELDRAANNLALEALTDPSGAFLGERYSIVYSPGMWLEARLRRPLPIATTTSLILLDASHAPGAGYLPGMEMQRNAISHLFPHTKLIEATKTDWKNLSSRLAASEILHYMGHGRLDGGAISLDYDGNRSLHAGDFLPQLFQRSQLVVLAACSTGKDLGLFDTNSLVHAVFAAEVPAVIASHWNVDSETTSKLMIEFYQSLAQGKNTAQAMFTARGKVLKSSPHPYYWAGFSLSGRPN